LDRTAFGDAIGFTTHTHTHTHTQINIYVIGVYGHNIESLWLLSKAFLAAKSYSLDGEQHVDKWNYGWTDKS